jgi:hypothetical protein
MNILTDRLPEEISVNGEIYPIKTDFRVWIKFSQMVEKAEHLTTWAEIIMLVVVGERLPQNFKETVSALLDFYTHQTASSGNSDNSSGKNIRAFDYEADAGHIYAAFLQQYNIDLTKTNMHWWAFKYLLDSISEDTQFGKIIQYRCTDTSKIKDKATKKSYEKLKRMYALPDKRTDAEKERDFAEGLSMAF